MYFLYLDIKMTINSFLEPVIFRFVQKPSKTYIQYNIYNNIYNI